MPSHNGKALPAYKYMQMQAPEQVPLASLPTTGPAEPPSEEEAEAAYQEKVKVEEEEKAKKPTVLYYDPNTGTTSTKDPDAPADEGEEEGTEVVWIELKTPKGFKYFYNIESKERGWKIPEVKKEKPPEEEDASEEKKEECENEEDDEEIESSGPLWRPFKTDDGFYFWNSDADPPDTSWGPPPKRIAHTAEEKERMEAVKWTWTVIRKPFKEEDNFPMEGKSYWYNPFSKQATHAHPAKMAFKGVPAWEEPLSDPNPNLNSDVNPNPNPNPGFSLTSNSDSGPDSNLIAGASL